MCHKAIPDYSKNTYLGFDLGSTKLKAVLTNSKLQVIYSTEVNFDIDLHEYKTTAGVVKGDDEDQFFANPSMWIEALEMAISCLQGQGADLHTVAAVTGSTQQCGTVYWNTLGLRRLSGLDGYYKMSHQLNSSGFAVCRSPTWQDSSAEEQSTEIQLKIGGSTKMIDLTGSRCCPWQPAPQIRKIYQTHPEEYEKTERISLVSSLLSSLLVGSIACIDLSDASSMGLLNLQKRRWSTSLLNACAPDLKRRLMRPIGCRNLQGPIAKYYVRRWNFRPDCMVVTCTGRPAALIAGTVPDKNHLVISLGTRDCLLFYLPEVAFFPRGHVFCHPYKDNEYIGFIFTKNAAIVRDQMCHKLAGGNWTLFNRMLQNTPMGNSGNVAVYFPFMEIDPTAQGTLRWTASMDEFSPHAAEGVEEFESPEIEARALIEGQMMHLRAIVMKEIQMKFHLGLKIIISGRTRMNLTILQILADVFNANVYKVPAADAKLMGSAYRARYGFYENREASCSCQRCISHRIPQPKLSYEEFMQKQQLTELTLLAQPTKGCSAIYDKLISRYCTMTEILTQQIKEKRESRF